MMKNAISVFSKLFMLLILAGSITSCSKEGCADPNAINFDSDASEDDGSCIYNNEVKVMMKHEVNGQALQLDTMIYTNEAGNNYSVVNLNYYISDITLWNAEGGSYVIDDIHYVDPAKVATLEATYGGIPEGTYNAVSVRFGISITKNVVGTLPGTEENVLMFWPEMLGGGYHFMKLEGRYKKGDGSIESYNTHMGGLMMNGTDYSSSFETAKMNLATPVIIKNGSAGTDFSIVMEINNWYRNPNIYDMNDYDDGVMNKPPVQTMLKENGQADVFSVRR